MSKKGQAFEPVLMDQAGINQLEAEISRLQEELAEVLSRTNTDVDLWDSADFNDKTNHAKYLAGQIQEKLSIAKRVTLIEPEQLEDSVNLGDVVSVDIIKNGQVRSTIVKLVGGEPNITEKVMEVSVNSPIGKALFRGKIGLSYPYKSGTGMELEVLIKSKVDVFELENDENEVEQSAPSM